MPLFDYWGPEHNPTRRERIEVEAIRGKMLSGDSMSEAYELLNAQMNIIHMRAMAIITITGVVVTVTGFSGRLIAGTSRLAQFLIISGLLTCILAATVTMLWVMPIRWLTSYMNTSTDEWLLAAIRRRDRKTRAFRIASILLIIGLTLYGLSICQMLWFPHAHEITGPIR